MELNDLRSAVTVISFIVFLAIVAWAWSGRRHQAFDDAAHLPLHDDEHDGAGGPAQGSTGANK